MMKISPLFFALFFFVQLTAQTKNEVERRIKKKAVPSEVKDWFNDAYENQRKVKWFYQTDGDKKVYEAKLMYKNKNHSVEIQPNGDIVNIEVQIELDEIQQEVRQKILAYFNTNYNRFSIKKIQIQYTGSNDDLEDLIDEDEMVASINVHYEIEFYGKNENENELWEGLFNDVGNLIERKKIVLKSTDNLDY